MDERIFPSELALLLVWLTAPAEIAMVMVLTVLSTLRGAFARPYRFRSVLALSAAYIAALIIAVPVWLLLPHALLPQSVLPARWPSLPPLGFMPGWIACFAAGGGAWLVICRRPRGSLPNSATRADAKSE